MKDEELDQKIQKNISAFDKLTLSDDKKEKLALNARLKCHPFYTTTAFKRALATAACLMIALAVTFSFILSGGTDAKNGTENEYAAGTDSPSSHENLGTADAGYNDSDKSYSITSGIASEEPAECAPSSEGTASSGTINDKIDIGDILDKLDKGTADYATDEEGYVPGDVSYAEACPTTDDAPDSERPTGEDTSGGVPTTGDEEETKPDYYAHILTAVEVNDITTFDKFAELVNGDFRSFADMWSIYPINRVTVNVTSGGKPANNISVYGLDGNGNTITTARTDINGRAYLYANLFDVQSNAKIVSVSADGVSAAVSDGKADINLETAVTAPDKADIMFICDTTGSMGDELEYLKAELKGIVDRVTVQAQAEVRLSMNFYRDDGDEYVVKSNAFTSDIAAAQAQLSAESANGGGDTPEAVDRALLNGICEHEWDAKAVKICVLVLDAPPHTGSEINQNLKKAIEEAQKSGIRIIPVVASGADVSAEYLLRALAAVTGGTSAFLTDDSGVGGGHIEPTTEEPLTVEYLDDLLVRVITSYMYAGD